MAGSRTLTVIYGASLVIHVVIGVGLNSIEVERPPEAVVVEMTTIEQPKEEEKPKEPEPEPPPVEAPKPAAKPQAAPPPPSAAPEAAPAPDFGFALSSGGGPGGVAVAAPKPPETVKQAPRKVLQPAAAKIAPEDTCQEEEVKAKAISIPKPVYSEEANTARIEGKVRVEITIDATGAVEGARVVEGLGHGLDEAAVAALREAKFSPATRCEKPVSSTFVVGVRFTL